MRSADTKAPSNGCWQHVHTERRAEKKVSPLVAVSDWERMARQIAENRIAYQPIIAGVE